MSRPDPAIRRYLRVLDNLTASNDPATRTWARECLRDMGEPGVSVPEYLRPVMTLPLVNLTPMERKARLLAA